MATFLYMPKLGMEMSEGLIVRWLKKEGETIQKGEPVAEIETDKSVMDVEANESGIILKQYYADGDVVPFNTPIASIGVEGESAELPSSEGTIEREKPNELKQVEPPMQIEVKKEADHIRVSPRAKTLATKENVALEQVIGSGPGGRIVEKDILEIINRNDSKVNQIKVSSEIKVSGVRKVTIDRMMQSTTQMAQANHRMEVNMDELLSFKKKVNLVFEKTDEKVSLIDILIFVCCKALQNHPYVNARLLDDKIQLLSDINIGIAVMTDRGLLVPVMHDVCSKGLAEISEQSRSLIDAARKGMLQPDEMAHGTFTITNLGMYDVDSFTAIINPPEAAILAVGKIAERPVVKDGQIVIRPMMTLSLTYDHRILDGAPAAEFLLSIKRLLENPALLSL